MRENGHAEASVGRYVYGINRYLKYIGGSSLQFNRSEQDDMGREYGYLRVIEPIGKVRRGHYLAMPM